MSSWNALESVLHKDYANYIMGISKYEIEGKYNWSTLTQNKAISLRFILEHQQFPWVWKFVTSLVPIDFIIENPSYDWDWIQLSQTATPDIVETFPRKPWDWKVLSSNVNVVSTLLDKHPEYTWDYSIISRCSFGINHRNVDISSLTPITKPGPPPEASSSSSRPTAIPVTTTHKIPKPQALPSYHFPAQTLMTSSRASAPAAEEEYPTVEYVGDLQL